MSFWIWALIYVAGFMVTYRVQYLRRLDTTQRWKARRGHHKVTRRNEYDHAVPIPPDEAVERRENQDVASAWLTALFWPVIPPILLMWMIQKVTWFLMFPRGIKTKFDREQELEKKLTEEQKNLEAAKRLLRQEGIQA